MNEEDFNQDLDEDNLEDEMDQVKSDKVNVEPELKDKVEAEKAEETYEIFAEPERIGIKDSRTGEPIAEGFSENDWPLLMVLKRIMNQLDKISIASGAQ